MPGNPGKLGGATLAISAALLLVSWPPPSLGLSPLLGFGTVFLAAPLSFVALFLAIVGGTLVVRPQARARGEGVERLAVGLLGPVVPVALEASYLVVVVGFGPGGAVIGGSILLAAVVGLLVWCRDDRRGPAPVT